ncbi:hypothetical protein HIM_06312 [Hirsutella minnesotensis 3608]|uniref:Chitinase n=1 Tax=Hirsutella minnesotensis 3608 TaxID=1043627 RepID=A0A0F7ZJD6_9HYPO|nr:hypothetical protein HIM_06312 [Hirsutella minnesotensis 3608]
MARNILKPAGVKVFWGFGGQNAGGRAYQVIRDGLDENESIGIDGLDGKITARNAEEKFQREGPTNKAQRIWSMGHSLMDFNGKLGDCSDKGGKSLKICPQLRYAVESKAFGKVFGWTVAKFHYSTASQLLYAGVDGLIYGQLTKNYDDSPDSRDAIKILKDLLEKNKNRVYLATLDDKPW